MYYEYVTTKEQASNEMNILFLHLGLTFYLIYLHQKSLYANLYMYRIQETHHVYL